LGRILFSRNYVPASLAIFGKPAWVKSSAAKQETKNETTRNWRRKPIEVAQNGALAELAAEDPEKVAE
jgi:hypothetical protein